jgi:hypothetical protein
LKKTAVSLLMISLLAACSSVPPAKLSQLNEAVPADAQAPARKKAQTASRTSAKPDSDPLPNVELTDDLLFKLLTAELASQRGQPESGFMAYMTAAQQTRDPRLARRAAEISLRTLPPDRTLAALQLWHQLAPRSEEASQYLASLIVLTDNVAAARPIFEERL